jgi:hypothetical protein
VERIKPGFPAILAEALRLIPLHTHRYLDHDTFTGTDPVFAGLHRYESASLGRSYRDIAHVVYPYHMEHLPRARRRVIVVMPTLIHPYVVVHELGHVLHHRLRFEPVAEPVTEYAQTNEREAFAEAFAAWVLPWYYPVAPDARFVAVMDSLGA